MVCGAAKALLERQTRMDVAMVVEKRILDGLDCRLTSSLEGRTAWSGVAGENVSTARGGLGCLSGGFCYRVKLPSVS